MISYKNFPLSLFCVFFFNVLFAQDYEAFSQIVFNDKSDEHVTYLKQVFQDEQSKQLIVDFLQIQVKDQEDADNTERMSNELVEEFNSKTTPDDAYSCKQFQSYKNDLEELNRSIEKTRAVVKLTKAAYELCTSNCDDEYESYNRQSNYLDADIEEYNSKLEIVKEYQNECKQFVDEYTSERNYYNDKNEEIYRKREVRQNANNEAIMKCHRQIVERMSEVPVLTTTYYDNGAKESVGYWSFKTEKMEGEFKHFHPDGYLESTTTLKNGKNHGTFTYYYETGVKKAEAEFENGVKVSEWIEYDENGKTEIDRVLDEINEAKESIRASEQEFLNNIDNSSVAQSINTNPIQTVYCKTKYATKVEMTIDFGNAPKEIVYAFLVDTISEKSEEIRNQFISDYFDHQYKKQLKQFNQDGNLSIEIDYNETGGNLVEYSDSKKTVGQFLNGNRTGIWKTYDRTGNVIEEVNMDEQNKQNAFDVFGGSSTNYADEYEEYLKEEERKKAAGNKD